MSKKRKKSTEYFHAMPENLNCAQAVLKGFQKEFNIPKEEVEAYHARGGGRVENGVCGALFAAKQLLEEEKNNLDKEFHEKLGSIYCRELKRDKKICEDCVRIADQLVEKRIKGKK